MASLATTVRPTKYYTTTIAAVVYCPESQNQAVKPGRLAPNETIQPCG